MDSDKLIEMWTSRYIEEPMEHLVIFSVDLHGNEVQYKKLIDFARSISADSLIIGGDIAPKRFRREHFISQQRAFLSTRLPELLLPFKEELPSSKIYLMMGNDDCACNMDILERYDNELFHLIHGRRLNLREDFDIVGYSFVPITPFMLKDWEKFDLSEVPPKLENEYTKRKNWNYHLHGFRSTLKGWRRFGFVKAIEKEDSIQKDLNESLFIKEPEKTVYVFHTPPDNTNLDQRYDGFHVGSMAVRSFIEEHQPYLTLHGHIHETVDVSGNFMEIIGNSISLSAGNDDFGNNLCILTFDLYNPEKARRVIV